MRNALRKIAEQRADWAGIPMPLDDQKLVIEPRYPMAELLMQMGGSLIEEPQGDGVPKEEKQIRSSFWSTHLRCEVVIMQQSDGKVRHGIVPGVHHFDYDIQTMGASIAWGLEQEQRALQLLGTLVRHHTLKMYLLSGMFLETSKRSGLTYCFRKLRPTVVLDTRGPELRIRCTLCLHPIGYYRGSWAGALCPTDDLISHLMLMRGDEPMLWRRANQHPPYRPESGL